MMRKPPPGICDRCGLRFHHRDLQWSYYKNRRTGSLVCKSCNDPTHPQEYTERVKTNDRQSVKNARSDRAELAISRRLFSWNPVGHPTTGQIAVSCGRVKVVT